MKKGKHEWGRKGATVVCKWKDKRDIYVISNKQQVQMVNAVNKRGEEKVKPNIVVDYNNHMSGVDHSDQIMSNHSSLRKVTKWYKVGVRVLELLLYNAYKMYVKETNTTMSELKFRETVIKHLLGQVPGENNNKENNNAAAVETTAKFHYPILIPPTEKKQNPTRVYRLCPKRKETQIYVSKMRWRCSTTIARSPMLPVVSRTGRY